MGINQSTKNTESCALNWIDIRIREIINNSYRQKKRINSYWANNHGKGDVTVSYMEEEKLNIPVIVILWMEYDIINI